MEKKIEKVIKTGSDFSGVGAFDQALKRLGIEQEKKFACDMDKFARQTYCLNYGNENDVLLTKSKEHTKMCDDLLNYYNRKTPIDEVEFEKYLNEGIELGERQNILAKEYSFYYPFDVNYREIPEESVDEYVTSPPCQSFSIAGKRGGKNDKRGILFFNSLEFIRKNKPRFFTFENVKGLLSHDKTNKDAKFGNTFQEWLNHLGGKSVNGVHTFFPYEDSVPYHIYYFVLNAKKHGIPQNRERVFIVGIRDNQDNMFDIPKPFKLTKFLKDCLEENVDDKYFLSDKMLAGFLKHGERHNEKGNGFAFSVSDIEKPAKSITTGAGSRNTDNFVYAKSVGFINQDTQASQVYDENGIAPTICAGSQGYANGYVETSNHLKIKSNTKKGFDILTENDSLNLSVPSSETRRGRIGKNVAQTLDTSCNQGVLTSERKVRRLTPRECFRCMDFTDDFIWDVSDTQAYKQAGNSIPVGLLVEIIKKLNL